MTSRNAEILERLARIESLFGPMEEGVNINLIQENAELKSEIQSLRETNATLAKEMENLRADYAGTVQTVQKLRDRHKVVKADVGLLRQVVGTQDGTGRIRASRKIPEPQPFNGARSAKDVENFVWDLEEYFSAAKVSDDEKVAMAARYLASDAKLWWRTRVSEDSIAGRSRIESWDQFKVELKSQFLPGNASRQAREAMKSLKQTGSVKDYVKEFCALLLNVQNMSEDDKLFNFESGLKSWAQQELRRQNVADLRGAIKAAEALVDNYVDKTASEAATSKSKKGRGVDKEDDQSQGAGKKADGGQRWNGKKPDGSSKSSGGGPMKCYICEGPHLARYCPKKEKLNALMVGDAETGNGQKEAENSELILLNTLVSLNKVEFLNTLTEDVDFVRQKLMQVALTVNGKEVIAMVDTGATHTVVSSKVVQKLGLRTSKCSHVLKMPNATAQSVQGMCYDVPMRIGTLSGRINMLAIPLDDFDMILGIDFLRKTRSCPMPHLNGLMVTHQNSPCFVPCVGVDSAPSEKLATVSAMTVEKGKRAVPVAYLAAVAAEKSGAGSMQQIYWRPKMERVKIWAARRVKDGSTRTSNSGGVGGMLRP